MKLTDKKTEERWRDDGGSKERGVDNIIGELSTEIMLRPMRREVVG